ncbi:MAG: orotidine-5'-phosphate decarboxylase [Oligoflexia bacterium]|nr:orotidine-5'-phosphate decarboxylase [Oligoflexia bacterium]
MSATLKNFADRVQHACQQKHSFLIAGFDPDLDKFPRSILKTATARSTELSEQIEAALVLYYTMAIETLAPLVVGIKPNWAYFEQYGLPGLSALSEVCKIAQQHGLLVIADCKRGDIGPTALAYARAFLGGSKVFGQSIPAFAADAMTVNPFLGFDTVEPFLTECIAQDKGIFVLVKTSNPGSADLQNRAGSDKQTISHRIAAWISANAGRLLGSSGFSALGAVVGATYPNEARELRKLMPRSLFLIPGFGAQGAAAGDAVSGFAGQSGAGLINVSRGLLSAFSSLELSETEMRTELKALAGNFNTRINAAVQSL